MKIFVTGGAGYIGSHTSLELLNAGYDVVAYDNLCNSHRQSIQQIEHLTGKKITFVADDIRNEAAMTAALQGCSAVIHFAGLKAVGESVLKPLEYYDNNIQGTLCLLRAMRSNQIKKLIFSSSATVYGNPQFLPLTEIHPLSATNPYGETKLMIERILRDLHQADPSYHIALLRYFNPVGAHESGLIGENPQGAPNNLMPFVAQVAAGKRDSLSIWGNDYPTLDGTGVRDYIHVMDLASGHIKALKNIEKLTCSAINLGTGHGYSVLEVVTAFMKASGKNIPYVIQPRRTGDVPECYSDPSLAKSLLDWEAKKTMSDMCKDAWKWEMYNTMNNGSLSNT